LHPLIGGCAAALQVERRIRELDRVLLMMRRSIRDKELAVRKSSVRIDERARHLNMEVCSDAMLAEYVAKLRCSVAVCTGRDSIVYKPVANERGFDGFD